MRKNGLREEMYLLPYSVEAERYDWGGFKTCREFELSLHIPGLMRFQGDDETGFLARFQHLFGMADDRKLGILRFHVQNRNGLGGHVFEPECLCGGGIDLH